MFADEQYSAGNGASTFIDAQYSVGNGPSAFADTQHSQVNGAPTFVDAPFRFDKTGPDPCFKGEVDFIEK